VAARVAAQAVAVVLVVKAALLVVDVMAVVDVTAVVDHRRSVSRATWWKTSLRSIASRRS